MKKTFNQLDDGVKKKLRDTLLVIYTLDRRVKNPVENTEKYIRRLRRKKKTSRKWHNLVYWKIQKAEKMKKNVLDKKVKIYR